MLIVSRQVSQKGAAAWGVLNNFLASANELKIPATVAATTPKPANSSAKVQAAAHVARSSTQDAVTPPSWSITSVTAEAKHIAKMAGAPEAAAVDDATRVVGQDTPSHRADAGMAWGTLIHGLLEHAMRHKDASRLDLRRLAMWLTVEEPQLRTVIDEALDTVQRVARADFWAEATAGEHTVEAPFIAASASRSLSSGVIDLLFRSDVWHIVDYKTDIGLTPGSSGAYAQQMKSYQNALKSVGIDDVESALHNLRGN